MAAARHARNGADSLEELPLERDAVLARRVQSLEVHAGHEDVIASEAGVECQEVAQAAHEEQRADQEHEGEGHL